MSISMITGKPGGGKGLLAMKMIEEEIAKGTRPVVTNVPVRLGPWVDGKGKANAGFLAYLMRKYGETFNAEKRIHVLTDEQTGEFYRWRVHRKTFELIYLAETEKSKDGACTAFDTAPAVENGGLLYVVDEAWKFFSARDWAKTGKAATFYAAQHRHLGDDFIIVTQNCAQVDKAMRDLAQDYHQIRNRSKERLGMFRQPDLFTVATYGDVPSKGGEPQCRTMFKLDVVGLGGSYDTSAGVGITGRAVADQGARKKGIHFGWLIAAAVLVCVLVVKLPFVLSKLAVGQITGKYRAASSSTNNAVESAPIGTASNRPPSRVGGGTASAVAAVGKSVGVTVRPAREIKVDAGAEFEEPAAAAPEAQGEWLTGLTRIGGRVWIVTNRRAYPPGHPAIELVTQDFVVIRGQVFRWPDTETVAGQGVAQGGVFSPVRRVRGN
jgi:hypothetical protein